MIVNTHLCCRTVLIEVLKTCINNRYSSFTVFDKEQTNKVYSIVHELN